MVLRSGKRRSLDKEPKSKADQTQPVKAAKESNVTQEPPEPEEQNFIALSSQNDVDSDDEAPEDVGFADAKESFLKEVRDRKRKSKEDQNKRKEKLQKKLKERVKEQKHKKKKAENSSKHADAHADALPQEFLDELSRRDREKKTLNSLKKFEEEDDALEEEEPLPAPSGNFQVIARKEEKKLNNVAESVLNFREHMMARHKRETSSQFLNRKAKLAQIGDAGFAKI